jgi:hypothetical protein
MTGSFGSLLNYGTINAAPGGFAIQTDSTAVGTVVFNAGVINGQVSIAAGPYARFENAADGHHRPRPASPATSDLRPQTSAGTWPRVAPNGVSDQLVVSGQARLAGTAQALFQSGTSFSKSYNLLTATGGLTGTFNTLSTQNLPAFLSASLGYSATNVTLNLQSSMASIAGLGSNGVAVGQALDGAFNNGSGFGAASSLFGLSAGEIGQALTVLSGSNASVGNSVALAAGGQFAALMANRALARQAAPQSATAELAAVCTETACEPANTNWSAWGTAFGGAQWLNADSGIGSPAAQQAIGGGAFGSDYRFGPQTVVGLAVGLSNSNYSVGATGASGRATGVHFRPVRHAELEAFYLNAPSPTAASTAAPPSDHRHRHDRDGNPPPSPTSWPGGSRSAGPSSSTSRPRPATGSRPLPPSSPRSSGRPPSRNRA